MSSSTIDPPGDSARNDRAAQVGQWGSAKQSCLLQPAIIQHSIPNWWTLELQSTFTHISWHSPSFTKGGISALYAFTIYILLVLRLVHLSHLDATSEDR